MRTPVLLLATLSLAACGAASDRPQSPAAVAPPLPAAPKLAGVDRVMGADARDLRALFGLPQQDVREEGARKLQFGNGICILDAYLYPPNKGKDPVVTYVSTRLTDGRDTDKAACINALSRKR